MAIDLAVRGRRVILPDGERAATILIEGGVIRAVDGDVPPGCRVIDAGDRAVLPGLVDSHVHVNEPGRTEWEGFETATRAAAAGGITTIVDMPLNCIPVTTTRDALSVKRAAIAGKLFVDCAFWGGVVPGNANEIEGMLADGMCGAKAFLVHSGIDDFPAAGAAELDAALPILARRGAPLLVHAELDEEVPSGGDKARYATWLASRPRSMENRAIRWMIELARAHRAPVHIVHLSSSEALPDLAAARASGVEITVETCPHYLTLAAEEVPDGATAYKCAPPIRERANLDRLWQGLTDGTIDLVVSDHSPCTPHLKCLDSGDFVEAWGGISSVQLALPVVWTAARARGISLATIVGWMCARPAKLAGLDGKKGAIAPGLDADLTLFDADAQFTVEPERIHHRHKVTPYLGRRLSGVVDTTILRGQIVFAEGKFHGPHGAPLSRAMGHSP
jgi:allantoinase